MPPLAALTGSPGCLSFQRRMDSFASRFDERESKARKDHVADTLLHQVLLMFDLNFV